MRSIGMPVAGQQQATFHIFEWQTPFSNGKLKTIVTPPNYGHKQISHVLRKTICFADGSLSLSPSLHIFGVGIDVEAKQCNKRLHICVLYP